MANLALIDLDDLTGSEFDSAYSAYLVRKVNRDGGNKLTRTRRKATAEWSNFVDDFMRACMRSRERIDAALADLDDRVAALETGGGVVAAIQAGPGIAVDSTDPENPVVISTLFAEQYNGGGLVESVEGIQFDQAAGFVVDDAQNPNVRISLSGIPRSAINRVAYEVDFSTVGGTTTNLLTGGDGTKTIDGRAWTLGNSAGLTTAAYGSSPGGISLLAAASSLAFNQSSQTAPYLRIPWATLVGASYNAARDYTLQLRFTAWTNPSTNCQLLLFVWGASNGALNGSTIVAVGPLGNVSTRVIGSGTPTRSAAPAAITPGAVDLVLSLKVSGSHMTGYIDAWASGWPNPGNVVGTDYEGGTNSTENMQDVVACPGFAFAAGNTSGNFAATIRALRVLES